MIPQNKSLIWGHLAGFTAYAIFGFNIVVCKDLTGSHLLSPIALFCLRSIGAGLLFWLLSAFMPREKVRRADFAKIAAASFLGFFMAQLTFLMAIPDITPMDCSIIRALSPLYTMFIAAWVLKEPITARKMGGVLLSLAGILFLIFNTAGTGHCTDDSEQFLLFALPGGIPSGHLPLFGHYLYEMGLLLFHLHVFAAGF